jgi:hypothetical protein
MSYTLSAKKTRAAVRDLALTNDEIIGVVQQHERAINILTTLAKRPFVGRLRWLLTGK